jgi:hypothetical protein
VTARGELGSAPVRGRAGHQLPGHLHRRGAQVAALTAAILLTSLAHRWHSVGHFFTILTIAGLTGVLAALAVAPLAGGYATIRRVTV